MSKFVGAYPDPLSRAKLKGIFQEIQTAETSQAHGGGPGDMSMWFCTFIKV